MAKNMLELRPHTPLQEKKEAVLTLFVFLTSLLLSCSGKCSMKNMTGSSNSTERTTRRKK